MADLQQSETTQLQNDRAEIEVPCTEQPQTDEPQAEEAWSEEIQYADDILSKIDSILSRVGIDEDEDVIKTQADKQMTLKELLDLEGDDLRNAFPITVKLKANETQAEQTLDQANETQDEEPPDQLANKVALYVFGGVDATSNVVYHSSAECLDIEARNGSWCPLPPFETARCEHAAAALGLSLYVLGGRHGTECLNSVEEFNLETEEWTAMPAMIERRCGLAAVAMQGVLYAVGGRSDTANYLSSLECFDGEASAWSRVPSPMLTRRCAHAAAAMATSDVLYVVGGHNTASGFASAEKYSLSTRIWTAVAEMEASRINPAAVVVKTGAVYVFGGSSHASAERYDPEKDEWSALPDMTTRRCRHAAVVISSTVYIFGGYDGSSYLNSVESYDVKKGSWTPLTPMDARRCDLAATTLTATTGNYQSS